MKKLQKPKANRFYKLAEQTRKAIIPEDEIEQRDLTDFFFDGVDEMIYEGEIIIININAKMRRGKSTQGFAVGEFILNRVQYHKKLPRLEFGLNNIARDQQEYSKLMRDPSTAFTCIVTDEDNALEHGGENVSAEEQLNKVFSDVQAARYVHRVCCSPKELIDPNADILLSIVAIDHKRKITLNKLFYRYYEGGDTRIVLLGMVQICVADIIKEWEQIKHIFFKFDNKTPTEQKLLEQAIKKDWYVHYNVKKHEKMDMLTKEGIFRPRMLDYAEAILMVINDLKIICKGSSLISKDIVRNYIKMKFRLLKLPSSITGIDLATEECFGILKGYMSYYKAVHEYEKLSKLIKSNKIDILLIKDKYNEIEKMKSALMNMIQAQEDELLHYKEINKRYNTK